MGAVYSVKLRLEYPDANSVISATRRFVDSTHKAKFSDVDYSSIVSAIQIILPKRGFLLEQQLDNYIACSCDFEASYGWEGIIYKWFESIAPALSDGSLIWIFPDDGFVKGVVQNNKVVWDDEDDEDDEDDWDEDEIPVGMKVDDPELQKAIDYINEFTFDEYGDIAIEEGSDLSDIGILFTYAGEDDEYMTEVSVNLNNLTINYFVNGELVDTDSFGTLAQMNDTLAILSFDWLYKGCCDQIDWDEDPGTYWGNDNE